MSGSIRLQRSAGAFASVEVSVYAGSPDTTDPIATVEANVHEEPGRPTILNAEFTFDNLELPEGTSTLYISFRSSSDQVGAPIHHGSLPFLFYNDLSGLWVPAGTAGLSFQITFRPASGTSHDAQLIPQGGAGTGIGSEWDTELCAFNFGEESHELTFWMFPRNEPFNSREFVEALVEQFKHWSARVGKDEKLEGFGAIVAQPAAQVNTTSRTVGATLRSSLAADLAAQAEIYATLPDGRRFGQFFRAEPASTAQPTGTTAFLLTTHDPSHFRVNVGIAAAADGTVVWLTPLSAAGSALAASHDVSLPVLGANTQINDVAAFFGLPDTPDLVIEVEVISGAAFSYASVVDGHGPYVGTSDPTTQLPVRTGSDSVTLLELGSVHGGNEFSGSAMLHNHDGRSASVRASFTPRGVTTPAATTTLSLPAGSTVGWDDVVGELFGRSEEVGTLVFTATNGAHISALGREFAVYRDGQGQVSGTAGQLMPGLTEADLVQPGATAHFLGVREGNGERSHVSVYNPGPGTASVTVASFSVDDGSSVASGQYSVRAGELLRINNVLTSLDPSHDGHERRVTVTTTARVHTLAYRVNANGDPVTLRPFIR